MDDLRFETIVPSDRQTTFRRFTHELSSWWPREFSWSGERLLVDIGMQPGPDGHLYEIGPYGLRLDWGRVLAWEPPDRVAFSWQIGPGRIPQPDTAACTEVDVTFAAVGSGTRVLLTHALWERHGPQGGPYRAAMASAWPYALERLAAHTGG